ncbi:MAG: 50S ribosomal protein L5 [Deltaproteobacteria bacterium]|jgi:large subunit ribosomal protein L5|nr:50S ribosomal protein L5 [Deltaproteobacteria bacterium]
MKPRYKEIYDTKVVDALKQQFKYENVHQIPKIEKIVLNMGVGEAVQNAKAMEFAVNDMTLIAGQKPSVRKSKKSIANFKLREGLPIGVTVTLRGNRMYEFMDRLLTIALPRVRDFRGVSKSAFDGRGNYSLGINEQIIFPEIDIEKTTLRGLSVTFVTTAQNNEEGKALLTAFGFPFRG